MNNFFKPCFFNSLSSCPDATAEIYGNSQNPELHGRAYFYNANCNGTLVSLEISGLPNPDKYFSTSFHGMHIHEDGDCTLPFDNTGNHYNPENSPHPFHAGDLPPLLSNCGYAYCVFYTSRFNVCDVVGRSLIIHEAADDFTTQPSGNSGEKIACGVICKC